MKLIIDIPEKVVTAIQYDKDYRYDIHTAIAQGIPYEENLQGRWRNLPQHKTSLRYRCSVCGSCARIKSLYCPWCGVKMEGVDE